MQLTMDIGNSICLFNHRGRKGQTQSSQRYWEADHQDLFCQISIMKH